jgi:hypothetical protein
VGDSVPPTCVVELSVFQAQSVHGRERPLEAPKAQKEEEAVAPRQTPERSSKTLAREMDHPKVSSFSNVGAEIPGVNRPHRSHGIVLGSTRRSARPRRLVGIPPEICRDVRPRTPEVCRNRVAIPRTFVGMVALSAWRYFAIPRQNLSRIDLRESIQNLFRPSGGAKAPLGQFGHASAM